MSVQNSPDLWKSKFPVFSPDAHKYDRGMAVIYGASQMTGATRLAAESCARIGAGLVKVIAPEGTGDIYRASLPAHIIVEDRGASHSPILNPKVTAVLGGPGCAADEIDLSIFRAAIALDHIKGIVMDAGAFSGWQSHLQELAVFNRPDKIVFTPHWGEFQKVFEGKLPDGKDKALNAAKAASHTNTTIVLKGPVTIIAGEGEVILNNHPVPWLATAGTGDVLAGMITGLIAQGMGVRAASFAAVWIHAEAGERFGPGLVASDLPDMIPSIISALIL